MSQSIATDTIAGIRDTAIDIVSSLPEELQHCRYADLRIEASEGKAAMAENGMSKFSGEDYGFSFGIRVIAGDELTAPGHFGQQIGAADLPVLRKRLLQGLGHAYQRAMANSRAKREARQRFGNLGEMLTEPKLARVEVRKQELPAHYEIDPRTVPLVEVSNYVREISTRLRDLNGNVAFNYIGATTGLERILFVSSEGASIDQTYAISQGTCYVVTQGPEGHQELYDFTGYQGGWEVMTSGIAEESIHFPNLMDFSVKLAQDTIALAKAKPLKATDKEVVVVTDPHYNALLCHEIVGHPTELDRALKLETGYAGRSWLLQDLQHNQLGRRIGSDYVTAFSDPTIQGFGHYMYDDEGTPARRVYHIENGIFCGFSNSRQTAAIMGQEPNGHYKATDASLVPLIRMSNTAFAPGSRNPQDIIREVDHGYYVVGHRIPSIAESRENFRITAMKIYAIQGGQLGELFRDGGLISDSRDFFMNVDATGTDFRLFPVPNCGKGQPMQTKRMSNGGPTIRSRAKLSGV